MEKLKDLNMTVDEIDRLTKAFRDEKFREMLRDYTQEISDPENMKRYEEEIKILEKERGNSVEFIHPKPFRALRTSVDGKQKCFINICASDNVEKPEYKSGVSEDGRRGQCWSLPHGLHPGRQDTDPKGNKIMIYDVIFHPDTLHIASRNKSFMDMVDSVAIQGIQNAFKVTLDKNNMRVMNTKYKGTPQPCVIRKPIPGYKAREPSEKPDPLAFPYPDEKRPVESLRTKPTDPPATKTSSNTKPKSLQIQPQETREPTRPNHTVKYRSVVDLQDFRCSRDSARGPRPKEIVVTIDLPLLKSVADTSLEVKEKSLLLESKKPAYRLELPLAYPVDEDKGEAKFNKAKGQLTVTLPVLPSHETFDFGPATTDGDTQGVGDDEGKGKESEEGEKGEEEGGEEQGRKGQEEAEGEESIACECREQERGSEKGEEEQRGVEEEKVKQEDLKQQTRVEEGEEQMRKGQDDVEGEEKWRKQKGEVEEAEWKKQNGKGQESVEEEKSNKIYEGGVVEKEKLKEQKQENETKNQSQLSSGTGKEGGVNLNFCLESTADIQDETEKTKENIQRNVQLEADAALCKHTSSEESHTAAPAVMATSSHDSVEDCCISQGPEAPAPDEANESGAGVSGSGKQEERQDVDVDDLLTEQISRTPLRDDDKLPPALLREVDKDGNETVISNHSTSVEFIFQNTLMFELD
ncbi:protein kintoun [Lates japonicus]